MDDFPARRELDCEASHSAVILCAIKLKDRDPRQAGRTEEELAAAAREDALAGRDWSDLVGATEGE
jgi:hypothetical protein